MDESLQGSLIAPQAADEYPESFPGSAQAQAVRSTGRALRRGSVSQWVVLAAFVVAVGLATGASLLWGHSDNWTSTSGSS
jgi:hypothetical protein